MLNPIPWNMVTLTQTMAATYMHKMKGICGFVLVSYACLDAGNESSNKPTQPQCMRCCSNLSQPGSKSQQNSNCRVLGISARL